MTAVPDRRREDSRPRSIVAASGGYFNTLLDRLRYFAHFVHVTPLPSPYVLENRLGSIWGRETYKGDELITFGYLFRTKRAAKEAYQLFRSWNLGDFIDRQGAIILSVIREEQDRYTILMFPGERGETSHAKARIEEEFGAQTDVSVTKVLYWFATFADYWDRPQMKAVVVELPNVSKVLLNCFFLKDGEPQPISKRPLELSRIAVADRCEVMPGTVESIAQWSHPWTGCDRNTREAYQSVFDDFNSRCEQKTVE